MNAGAWWVSFPNNGLSRRLRSKSCAHADYLAHPPACAQVLNPLHAPFRKHLAWTSDHPLGLVVERAEGAELFVEGGRRIIDLISGIAVSSIGHGHPAVRKAIHEQVDRHLHVMVYGEFLLRPQIAFAELLTSLLPDPLQVCYFTSTGTEANEGAIKVARKHTGRSRIVAFERSYHGDTMGSLSVTGREVYRRPFEPLVPGVTFLPFDEVTELSAIDETTACVITEVIQGEGGIRVPSDAWMHALRQRCSDFGTLLIFDEVQTGFGRTGSLFAFEQFGVVPDIITLAKAMGGGMPLGAFISSADVMSALRVDPPLNHVTTFGGHPVSCAAAEAALKVLIEGDLTHRAWEIERIIRDRLRHPRIVELRGRGAMLGMMLDSPAFTARVVRRCLDAGVLLGWTLHADSLVRIAPPLTIPEPILHSAVDRILEAVDQSADQLN